MLCPQKTLPPPHHFTLDHRDQKKNKNNERGKTKQKHGAQPGRALPAAIKRYIEERLGLPTIQGRE